MTDDERQLLTLLARRAAPTLTRDDRELILRLVHAIEAAAEREAVERAQPFFGCQPIMTLI